MIHLTGLYRNIDRSLVQYVPNHTDVPTHSIVGRTNKPVYTSHISSLSDWFIPPIPDGTLWYDEL